MMAMHPADNDRGTVPIRWVLAALYGNRQLCPNPLIVFIGQDIAAIR